MDDTLNPIPEDRNIKIDQQPCKRSGGVTKGNVEIKEIGRYY
ncbi:MAG: hypothetical protein AB1422_19095 [bacterium]